MVEENESKIKKEIWIIEENGRNTRPSFDTVWDRGVKFFESKLEKMSQGKRTRLILIKKKKYECVYSANRLFGSLTIYIFYLVRPIKKLRTLYEVKLF